jgi:molecular chaperone GrpE (heat shock protein)
VPKADNTEDDAYSESDGSGSSNSSDDSDDIVLLDGRPSDWEEPAQKRRKLSVVARASPEDEVKNLQEQLAKMEEVRLRAEQECQKIRSRLARLNAV